MDNPFGKKEPKLYGFNAAVVFLCGCGNPAPIMLPYVPSMAGLVTCPTCKSKISLGGFTWQLGDSFPAVVLNVTAPSSIIAPPPNAFKKS